MHCAEVLVGPSLPSAQLSLFRSFRRRSHLSDAVMLFCCLSEEQTVEVGTVNNDTGINIKLLLCMRLGLHVMPHLFL
jgi:hypothetical protein